MRFVVIFLATLLFLVLSAPTVFADEAEKSTVRYKKKTEIDFDDVNIDGALKQPHGSYLLEKRQTNFNPLITLKENFDKEIHDSVQEIR
tara:strand:- start:229 stop:495 length:267 start_codon:yes stop_codon:yes gene_type:complete